ncbi:hypothetical protein EYF80_009854 [Liparis tanakae]|uniref:Uncharacterized protein n=1 Tax=Liparis tanakae TaxID=230148 RepID=A0A4Z2IPU1_9TELE|nr:hypothetical protein EYF80_009854 [Liparis tanakae]
MLRRRVAVWPAEELQGTLNQAPEARETNHESGCRVDLVRRAAASCPLAESHECTAISPPRVVPRRHSSPAARERRHEGVGGVSLRGVIARNREASGLPRLISARATESQKPSHDEITARSRRDHGEITAPTQSHYPGNSEQSLTLRGIKRITPTPEPRYSRITVVVTTGKPC